MNDPSISPMFKNINMAAHRPKMVRMSSKVAAHASRTGLLTSEYVDKIA